MDNQKVRLREIARAFVKNDFYAIEYHNTLRDFVRGNRKKIWVNIAKLECLQHLKIF